jgi:hypothetical protein
MATGLSAYLANQFLDAVGNATAYSAANVYVKLHIGDPGANGTGNPATETTRKAASFSAATAGGITSDADVSWTNIAGSEDATFFSVWDNATAGNFLFSGAVRQRIHSIHNSKWITNCMSRANMAQFVLDTSQLNVDVLGPITFATASFTRIRNRNSNG